MKNIEEFYNEIISDKALAEKLAGVSSEEQLEAFLKENDAPCTKEQFKEFMLAKAKEKGELTDEQIAEVSGGSGLIDQYNTLVTLLSQYDDLKDKVNEINQQLARGNKSFYTCFYELREMWKKRSNLLSEN